MGMLHFATALLFAASTWTTSGPPGRPGQIVVDPSDSRRAYAATDSGLFRSFDTGRTWARSSLPGAVSGVVIAPSDPAVLLAYSKTAVMRSADRGESWAPIGIPLYSVISFAIDPRDSDTFYLTGIFNTFYSIAGYTRSTDRGQHWDDPFTFGITPPPLLAAGSPESGAVLGLFPYGEGWRTTDRGATLEDLPLLFPLATQQVVALAGDQAPGATDFYAATRNVLYGTGDSGRTWPVAGPSPPFSFTIQLAVSPGLILAATDMGVFRSGNGGGSWDFVLAQQASSVSLAPGSPDVVLAAAGIDVWRSEDTGRTFSPAGANLPNANISNLFVDSNDRVFAWGYPFSGGPAFELADPGEWQQFSEIPALTEVFALDSSDPSTQYRSPYSATGSCPPLEKSVDAGKTWSRAGAPGCVVEEIAVDPNDSNRVIVTELGGIALSVDGGATWKQTLAHPPLFEGPIRFDRRRPGRVYAGFFTSADGGETWTIGTGPCAAPATGCQDGVLAIDDSTGKAYAIWRDSEGGSRLAVSADFGLTWTKLPAGDSLGLRDLDIDPVTGDLLAATALGVFRSSDGGGTLLPVDPADLASLISAVRVRADGSLFAASGLVWELGPTSRRQAPTPPSRRRFPLAVAPRVASRTD